MQTRFDAKSGESRTNCTLAYQVYKRRAYEYKQAQERIAKATDPAEREKLTKALPLEPREPEVKEVALNFGMEGLLCWNWTKLGFRKFNGVALGNCEPGSSTMIAWNDTRACALKNLGRNVALMDRAKIRPAGESGDPQVKLWEKNLPPGCQTTALAFCSNAIVVGGGVYDEKTTDSKGFVEVLSCDKGEIIAERSFSVPLAYNGLAVAGGKVYATFEDGTVACLGAGKRSDQ
jgi:hypothetical protein